MLTYQKDLKDTNYLNVSHTRHIKEIENVKPIIKRDLYENSKQNSFNNKEKKALSYVKLKD